MSSFNVKGSRFMGRGALASHVPFVFTPLVGLLLPWVCLNLECRSGGFRWETVSAPWISTSGETARGRGAAPTQNAEVCSFLCSARGGCWRRGAERGPGNDVPVRAALSCALPTSGPQVVPSAGLGSPGASPGEAGELRSSEAGRHRGWGREMPPLLSVI